jgi:hypothetical protein
MAEQANTPNAPKTEETTVSELADVQQFVDFLEPMRFDRPSDDERAVELDKLGRAVLAKAGAR